MLLAAARKSDLVDTFGPIAIAIVAIAAIIVIALVLTNEGKSYRMRERIKKFLRKPLDELTLLQNELQSFDLPNFHRAIEVWTGTNILPEVESVHSQTVEPPSAKLIERINIQYTHDLFSMLMANSLKLQPTRYEMTRINPRRRIRVPTAMMYLIEFQSSPIAIWNQSSGLCIAGPDELKVDAAVEELRRLMQHYSFYRGQVLSVAQDNMDDYGRNTLSFQFHNIDPVDQTDIVLPAETFGMLKRSTVDFFSVVESLVEHGQPGSRGILLHGSPGTGKTLVTRWLLNQLDGVTKFLLSGMQLVYLKQTVQVARMLSPSILVLDDVDLIATQRENNMYGVALHDLMNIMDGVDQSDRIMFILSTNRPEVIESAIIDRPGRIDQAIHFPLPDAECRHRLLRLFARDMDLQQVDIDRWVKETQNASPAFLRELIRRATQSALLRAQTSQKRSPDFEELGTTLNNSLESDQTAKLILSNDDFRVALADMMAGSGALTKRLLGFS